LIPDTFNIYKPMDKQIEFYQSKLDFEMDPSDLFTALERGEKVLPVDTRQPFGYDKEHIPGAINLPHRLMDENTTMHLDTDNDLCLLLRWDRV